LCGCFPGTGLPTLIWATGHPTSFLYSSPSEKPSTFVCDLLATADGMTDVPRPFASGASAGLGLALTRTVLARGDLCYRDCAVVAAFRRTTADPKIDGTRLRPLALDVTSPIAEIKQCVDEALAIWGRVGVLVNNAGRVAYGVTEELGCVFARSPVGPNQDS